MSKGELASSLDSPDYDPIGHLNAIFSHPSTLSSVPQTSTSLQRYQNGLDIEISDLVRYQSTSDVDSVKRIQASKRDLAELFRKIEGVQERAIQTEQAITEMTAEIKRLDNTKKNLTLSMTALKRLQMLTTAYEQLQGLSSSRQYRECAQLLQAVIQLMAHFKTYRSIDQIATLSRNVSDVQRELLEQVCEDFELTFAKEEVAQRRGMLSEACLVMDALGDNARSRLITWYCNTQLREYRQVFRGSDEAGSLDNISRRYSWFKRMMKTYDDHHAAIFPVYWHVDEMLANAFCEGTRDDFKGILAKSVRRSDGQTLDVNLLLSCLQETLEFEHGLEKKFTSGSRVSLDTISSGDIISAPFSHAISEAFEPYLSAWVDAQDKQLSLLIPKYRSQPPRPPDEEFNPQMVIPSSTELFAFYRQTFAQCAKLSTGARLVELSKVFAKYLDQYAQQILLYYISERPTGATPSRIPSIEDMVLVLNTADYCYNTSTQLEERIKGRVDAPLASNIDLQSQADAFMGIASATIQKLVRKVEVDLEPSWREMRNTRWSNMQATGDQSIYVSELLRRLRDRAKEIMLLLYKPQYARAFCDNLVELIATSYAANISQCKPISEIGAEQMLLDTYTLSTALSHLPTFTFSNAPSTPSAPPSNAFTKRVQSSMSRTTPLLKTLQVRPSPAEALVTAYLIHLSDKSESSFRKLLELKGIPRSAQPSYLEIFAAHKNSPRFESLPAVAPTNILTTLPMGGIGQGGVSGTLGVGGAGGGIGGVGVPGVPGLSGMGGLGLGSMASSAGASLTAGNLRGLDLQGRFDPTGLGTALMTAARDGVDRLNLKESPSVSASASRAVSPPPTTGLVAAGGGGQTGSVNQNLRNIGKFFRRDLGGFGGSFRGGGVSGSGGGDGGGGEG